MLVHTRCFAVLRELSVDRCDLDLPDGATVDDAWTALAAHPQLAAVRLRSPREARRWLAGIGPAPG